MYFRVKMPTFKNVNNKTMEEFFKSFDGDDDLVLHMQNAIAIIYKHPRSSLTLTIFRTTRSVSLQGKEDTIMRHVNLLSQLHESNKSASSNELTQSPYANPVSTECPTPRNYKRNKSNPIHVARFNDFRDDITSFISTWKPSKSLPAETIDYHTDMNMISIGTQTDNLGCNACNPCKNPKRIINKHRLQKLRSL